jgi:cytochrome c biogenesis protein CcmG, thiol:disulfide interchange protein DsbE
VRRRAVVAISAAAVLALLVGGLLVVRSGTGTRSTGIESVRGITLQAFGAEGTVPLDGFRGRPLVVNYWATWCTSCVAEMPDFQEVYAAVSDRVQFLGVDVQDDPEAAKRFVRRTGVKYRIASDPVAAAFKRMKVIGMPTTYFVDADGDVLERFTGPLTADDLRGKLRRHFDV